ncbi:pectinesterase family protein [Catenovulum sp. 2E275]|uniref:pectinesterase family protein n=1 Tax=Catenovulum sp. 2E275 TaxID=2980497 RepID=UPI0021D3D126|nr:pectinesterase family protein [Catenovulum sp. 2E275]MCU4677099.1 pectinesterase family protein [Catenovulum sp. 2E275]
MTKQLLALCTGLILLCACAANQVKTDGLKVDFDVVVAQQANDLAHWQKQNYPVYKSVQAALDAGPKDNSDYKVFIAPGRYYERVIVVHDNVSFYGAGEDKTIITYDIYAGKKIPGTDKNYGTSGSTTFRLDGKSFYAEHLTIENGFDYPANEKLDNTDENKVGGEQAVALKIMPTSDKNIFKNVTFKGYQDTLYVDGGRNYFYQNKVYGHIDFIFGRGIAVFDKSDIISQPRFKDVKYTGYITAPSTQISQPYGFTFIDCRLLKANGVTDGSVPLGRPWHPTTTFHDGRYADPFAIAKTVFINTYMDTHISDEGWASMSGTSKVGGEKVIFTPQSSRFFEYKSYGPGAKINPERRQLSDFEVDNFYQIKQVLGGWQPKL